LLSKMASFLPVSGALRLGRLSPSPGKTSTGGHGGPNRAGRRYPVHLASIVVQIG
jgi:hypothetical protein